MMKFLFDSCISKFAVDALRDKGYDAIWIIEEDHDPGDDVILQRAYHEDRILVTADKDFGKLVFVFMRPHPTIIQLVNIRAKDQGKKLLKIIEKYKEEFIHYPLITVDQYKIRIKFTRKDEE